MEIKLDTAGLDAIIRKFKQKFPEINVGVLGDKNSRTPGQDQPVETTNAEIGLYHEFGTSKLPQRSFLRMPLETRLDSYLNAASDLKLNKINEYNPESLADKIGIIAKRVILDAFASGGFGEWKQTETENNTGMTLVDTQQLRDSINFEVVK